MKHVISLFITIIAMSLTGCVKQAEDLYNKFFSSSASEPFDNGYFIFVGAKNELSCEESMHYFGNCCQGERFSIDKDTNMLVQLSSDDKYVGEGVEFRTKEACEATIKEIKSKLKLASGDEVTSTSPEVEASPVEAPETAEEKTLKPFFSLTLSEFKESFPQAFCSDFKTKGVLCAVEGGAFSPSLSEVYQELKCDQINKAYGAHFVDGVIAYGFCNIPAVTFQSFMAEGKLLGQPKTFQSGVWVTNVYAFDMGMKKMEFTENIKRMPNGESSVYYVAEFNTNPI